MICAPLKTVGVALVVTGLACAIPAHSYPTQSIRLMVPFAGGSPCDVVARVLAEGLRSSIGQTVVVENKPGAAGRLALTDLLTRPKDGHTLHLCSHIVPNNTVVLKNPGYKLEDLTAITLVAKSYYALTVSNAVAANSLQEFIRYAKSRADPLNYGRVGPGGITELVVRQFEQLASFKAIGVTFKGTHEAIQEMAAERLDFVIGPYNLTIPLHEAKKVKVLAMTSPARLSAVPDIPTFVEQQVPIVKFGWWGVCAAAGVPRSVIDQLNIHITAAVGSSAYRTVMEQNGMTAATYTPEEINRIMLDSAESTGKLMRELGIPQID